MIGERPPTHVLKKLRNEINFGCPVRECGVPYLEYHHFDPPWREKKHHNPEGMIALCPLHHSLADGGRWTKDQLNNMKMAPYIKHNEVSDVYEYLRKNFVIDVGLLGYEVESIIKLRGESIIHFKKDDKGYNRINMFIRDINMEPVLVMEDNNWIVYRNDIYDLKCSAQGKLLEIISNDKITRLKLSFNDYPINEFKQRYSKGFSDLQIKTLLNKMGNPETISTFQMRGTFRCGPFVFQFTDHTLHALSSSTNISLAGSLVMDAGAIFGLGG